MPRDMFSEEAMFSEVQTLMPHWRHDGSAAPTPPDDPYRSYWLREDGTRIEISGFPTSSNEVYAKLLQFDAAQPSRSPRMRLRRFVRRVPGLRVVVALASTLRVVLSRTEPS